MLGPGSLRLLGYGACYGESLLHLEVYTFESSSDV